VCFTTYNVRRDTVSPHRDDGRVVVFGKHDAAQLSVGVFFFVVVRVLLLLLLR
jgi:hypothetical protein